MTRAAAKAVERNALDLFRARFPDFPKGVVQEGETPDFVVGPVGIEHTRFFRVADSSGRVANQIEADHSKLMRLAREIYSRDHPDDLWVSALFQPHGARTRISMRAWAQRLAAVVAAHVPAGLIPDQQHLDWFGLADPELQHVLNSVSIRRLPKEPGDWSTTTGGVLGGSVEEVARAVGIKEKVVSTIKGKVPEAWLLIDATGGTWSTTAALTDTAKNATYVGSFDRAFLLDRWEQGVVELRLKRP